MCVDKYLLRSDPTVARRRVLERDRGICALCGLDTQALALAARAELTRVEAIPPEERANWPQPLRDVWRRVLVEFRGRDYEVPVMWGSWRGRAYSKRISAGRLWQADHIVPVAEGGGACGLDNLRTLCVWCHPRETGALRRRLNARAKSE